MNEDEPKPALKALRCPAGLAPEASKAWRRLAPKLAGLGLLTEVDWDALLVYCTTYARWVEAEDFLRKNGITYEVREPDTDWATEGALKAVKVYPQVAIAKALAHTLKCYQQEFGLTPSSRSNLKVRKEAPKKSRLGKLKAVS